VVARDAQNKPLRITGIVFDMTGLKESENKYKHLFNTMAQGVVYQNQDGKITAANPAAEQIPGLSTDQLMGRESPDPRWKAIHEDGSDFPGETHPSMMALLTGKEVRNQVMGVFHPKENKHRWIIINAIPQFKEGETAPYQVFATFDDVTELKERENQVVRTRKLFYQLLENSPVGKLVVTKNGRITYANKHAEEIFALPAAEIEHRFYNNPDWKITDLDGKEIPDEELPFRQIADGKNQIENYRLQIENGAGKRICLSINGSPMFDESGNVDGVVFSLEELSTE